MFWWRTCDELTKRYRPKDFAALAGVTARTLRHYERLKLLIPARSSNGYRLYSASDLERLEQIVALKRIGLPLTQIRTVLEVSPAALPHILQRQRELLEKKRAQLSKAIAAIGKAESALGKGASAEQFLQAIVEVMKEVMEMQNDTSWVLKYFNESAKQALRERPDFWPAGSHRTLAVHLNELIAELEAAAGQDPSSPTGKSLAERWRQLTAKLTAEIPDLPGALKSMYADRPNWPPGGEQQMEGILKIIEPMARMSAPARTFLGQAMHLPGTGPD